MSTEQDKQIPLPAEGEVGLGGMTERKIAPGVTEKTLILGTSPNLDLRAPGMLNTDDLSSGSVPLSDVPESIQRVWADGDRRDLQVRQLQAIRKYQVSRWVYALHFYLCVEIKRVYFNYWGRNWDINQDPGIDGILWRPKRDRISPKNPEAYLPNFEFEGVGFWWPGREPSWPMETNVNYGDDPWIRWFNNCHNVIRNWETVHEKLPRPCTCKLTGCPTENGWGCKGECGCVACEEAYADFLADDR